MKSTTSPKASRPPGFVRKLLRPSAWRAALGVLLGVIVLSAGFAVAQPGMFRLLVLQPARDALFFHRELEPFRNFAEIQAHDPRPTETVLLPAKETIPHSVDIALDVWLPDTNAAPAAVLLHGASPRGRKLAFNRMLAERLRLAGFAVFTPDARGFGDSGIPDDPEDSAAWDARPDIARIVDFARSHELTDGRVVAIGHSMGGAMVLDASVEELRLLAVVAIGPTRAPGREAPSLWERARFSSDRRIGGLPSNEVITETARRSDILRLASEISARPAREAILLMDGEREGEALIDLLRDAAAMMGSDVTHVTVPGSHHYCAVYALPIAGRKAYVRPTVFDRCVNTLLDFLLPIVGDAQREGRQRAPSASGSFEHA